MDVDVPETSGSGPGLFRVGAVALSRVDGPMGRSGGRSVDVGCSAAQVGAHVELMATGPHGTRAHPGQGMYL